MPLKQCLSPFPSVMTSPVLQRCLLSHSVGSDSLWPCGPQPTRPLCPWDSPGKNPEVGFHSLLQGIFPTQGLNPGLLHCRCFLYHLRHKPFLEAHVPVIRMFLISGFVWYLFMIWFQLCIFAGSLKKYHHLLFSASHLKTHDVVLPHYDSWIMEKAREFQKNV